MIKILVADDHTMFADGIESILADQKELKVVGKCYDGAAIFPFLEKEDVDVLLLDVNLPIMNGIDVCKKLGEISSSVKVLALTMHNEESFVTEILKFGALGYILKNTGKNELINAIKRVAQGESYFSKDVTQTIMKSLVSPSKKKEGSKNENLPKISRREQEVLDLIVKEFTTQEIANQLFISLKTVESHRRSLLTKLNVRNTAGLVRVAIENQLLTVEQ